MGNKEDRSDVVIGTRWRRPRGTRVALLIALGVAILGGSAAASYYVDALWFESLGFVSVFWTRLSLQAATFASLCARHLSGGLRRVPGAEARSARPVDRRHDSCQPAAGDAARRTRPQADRARAVVGNRRRDRRQHDGALDDVGPVLGGAAQRHIARPHFRADRSIFTCLRCRLLQLIAGWLLSLSVIACLIAAVFVLVIGGTRILTRAANFRVQTETLARPVDSASPRSS